MSSISVSKSRPWFRVHVLHVARARACYVLFSVLLAAGAHAQTCLAPANNDWTAWLQAQENAGGHAKACHLGVAVNGLIGRIDNRGENVSGVCQQARIASSWSDAKSLLDAVRPIILQNAATIANGPAGTYSYDGRADQTIGTSVERFDGKDRSKNRSACDKRSDFVCTTTRSWVVVIRKTVTDCFLLTAYPT